MVLLAVGEWARFGRQLITYSSDAPPRTEQLGIQERDAPERIADYWASVGKPGRSGLDDIPWSAAFISWDIESAGVPRSLFCPDQTHTIYVERLVERARQPGAAFIPRAPRDRAPGTATSWSRSGPARFMSSAATSATRSAAASFHWTAAGFCRPFRPVRCSP